VCVMMLLTVLLDATYVLRLCYLCFYQLINSSSCSSLLSTGLAKLACVIKSETIYLASIVNLQRGSG